jgi:NO-binding membrane sensor protein with MHYT domain
MRRELAVLVGLVLAVDAGAIALWLFTGLRRAGPQVQLAFAVAWTVATLAVVIVSLRKIRLLRGR